MFQKIQKKISDFYSNLNNYFNSYKNKEKEFLIEFFNIKETNLFGLDISLPRIPKELTKSGIHSGKMNQDSKNVCVPIINIDSEGINLICCYKSLELDLGKVCPALYYKP